MKTTSEESASISNDAEYILGLTSEVIAAYVANNPVSTSELPNLISDVYSTMRILAGADGDSEESDKNLSPAVPIKKSVQPDYIICLEDGQKFKSLKRHLSSYYDMTPDEYRKKWDLPKDYPMVAPNYAKARSELAKQIGLGRKPKSS